MQQRIFNLQFTIFNQFEIHKLQNFQTRCARLTHFWLTLHIAMQSGLYHRHFIPKFSIPNYQFSIIRGGENPRRIFAALKFKTNDVQRAVSEGY